MDGVFRSDRLNLTIKALAKAQPNMISTLDTFRETLDGVGGGLGVTDPVSGPAVLDLK